MKNIIIKNIINSSEKKYKTYREIIIFWHKEGVEDKIVLWEFTTNVKPNIH